MRLIRSVPEEMKDSSSRAVQLAAEDDFFKSIAYAALKVKARKLGPGEIVRIWGYELVVAEDEECDGITIQIIQSREYIENLARSKARKAGIDLSIMSDDERWQWMRLFLDELSETLSKWQEIEIRHGPGDNLTFERAVYKRSYAQWR